MKPTIADKKLDAAICHYPFSALAGDSQKSPPMVHASDLAEFIDKKRKEAKEELKRMHEPLPFSTL